jgi:hypothetical protein
MSLKFYGPHGVAKETLASGGLIPDGDFIELERDALDDPHNVRLLKEGKLLPASKAAQKAVDEAVASDGTEAPVDPGGNTEANGGGE